MENQTVEKKKVRKGFASMNPAKRLEIQSKGGKAAHQSGKAHEFTSEEAKAAAARSWQLRHKLGTDYPCQGACQ